MEKKCSITLFKFKKNQSDFKLFAFLFKLCMDHKKCIYFIYFRLKINHRQFHISREVLVSSFVTELLQCLSVMELEHEL